MRRSDYLWSIGDFKGAEDQEEFDRLVAQTSTRPNWGQQIWELSPAAAEKREQEKAVAINNVIALLGTIALANEESSVEE